MNTNIPYEIHVTVDVPSDVEHFRETCKMINVKPIILDLNNNTKDAMTSSKYKGDDNGAYLECIKIKTHLINSGYNVIREKIESVPWHHNAPTELNTMPKDCYFESHISVIVNQKTNTELLMDIAIRNNAHLSRNFFKKYSDDEYIQMLTIRDTNSTSILFSNTVNKMLSELNNNNLKYDKVEIEFALYDSKVSHDANWINKK